MKTIELNHWYIRDNSLAISLMNMCVIIEPVIGKSIKWLATFIDENQKREYLEFESLEDAVEFVETNKRMRTHEEIKVLSKKKTKNN